MDFVLGFTYDKIDYHGQKSAKNEGREDNNKTLVVKESARALTAAEFHQLGEVPPAIEWFGPLGPAV